MCQKRNEPRRHVSISWLINYTVTAQNIQLTKRTPTSVRPVYINSLLIYAFQSKFVSKPFRTAIVAAFTHVEIIIDKIVNF